MWWLGRFDDEELTEFGKGFIPKIPSEIFIMPVAEVPPPPAPPAPQQGRRASSKNYGIEETRHLFAILTTIVPIGPDEWQRVCDEHNLNYPGRDLNSIKRRYATLYRKQMPTGNPNMPWEVREAKTIKRLIGEKAMMGDGQEHFDLQQGFGNNNPAPTLPARDPTPTPLVLTEASRARNNIEPRNLEPRSTVTNSKRSYNRSGTSDILEAMSLSLVMQENDRVERQNDRVERREQSKAMVEAFTKAAAGLAEIFAPKKKRRKTKRTFAEASALAKRTGLDDSDSSDSDSDSDLDLDNLIR